jgi:hypothetical protein
MGSATNLLEVDHKVDAAKLTFKVNGQDVHSMDAGFRSDGIVGIRANHNLTSTSTASTFTASRHAFFGVR